MGRYGGIGDITNCNDNDDLVTVVELPRVLLK